MQKKLTKFFKTPIYFSFLFLVSILYCEALLFAVELPVELLDLNNYSRIIVKIDPSVQAKWKQDGKGFELFLKDLRLTDLGAPFGMEEIWRKSVENLSGTRARNLKLNETKEGVFLTGQWIFPTGTNAPAYPQMLHFDYRKKDPPAYIVDFWKKEGPTVAEVKKQKEEENQNRAIEKAKEKIKIRKITRKIREEQLKDAADLTKFCKIPLSNETDLFLPFRPVHEEVDFAKWFPLVAPDKDYPYYIPTINTQEAEYVKLAHQLYRDGKFGLVVRTSEFLEKEYPDSRFTHEMLFLKANALIKLQNKNLGNQIIERLTKVKTKTAVSLYSGMYLVGERVRNKDFLGATEGFLWLIENYPEHTLSWVFHLGVAESFYKIKQMDRAQHFYEWISENVHDEEVKAMAAFKIGDTYMERKQYPQALTAYFKAINAFKDQVKNYPAVLLNRAEALYWLGEYDKARTEFEAFDQAYRKYPYGWRATFRLSEIYARFENPNYPQSRLWLHKTINQYPFSPGTVLARIRLVPCGEKGGFDYYGMNKFFTDHVEGFNPDDEIFMSDFIDFKNLYYARALIGFKKYREAVAFIADKVEAHPQGKNRTMLEKLVLKALRKYVLEEIESGRDFEAVSFFEKYSKYLKFEEFKITPDFLIQLSQAALRLNLGKLSSQYLDQYKVAKNLLFKSRSIAQDVPGFDKDIEKSEESFTEAKAIWVTYGLGKSKEIEKLLSEVNDASRFSFEKSLILAGIFEERKEFKKALDYVVRANLLVSKNTDTLLHLRTKYWVGKLQENSKELEAALKTYNELQSVYSNKSIDLKKQDDYLKIPAIPNERDLIVRKAETLEKLGRWQEAAFVFQFAQEKGFDDHRILYGFAMNARKAGNNKMKVKSIETLKKIIDSKENSFWKELAIRTLAGQEETL